MRFTLFLAILFLSISACNRDDCNVDVNTNVDQTQLAADVATIDVYLAAEGIQA